MNLLTPLAFFTFSIFVFLAGYTVRLWLPPEIFLGLQQEYLTSPLTSSWSTTIAGSVESVSSTEMTVADSARVAESLRVRFHETLLVRRMVQQADEQGTVQIEEISLEELREGDRVIVYASIGNDKTLYATRIDKVVNIVP